MTEYDWSEQALGGSESECFPQVRGQVTTTGVQRNAGTLLYLSEVIPYCIFVFTVHSRH